MKDEYTFDSKEILKQRIRNFLCIRKKRQEIVSFKGRFSNFDTAQKMCEGYASDIIFNKIKTAALAVKNGQACYERDGYLFYEKDYYLQLIAVLYEIYLSQGNLHVIDFGGSLGSTYYQNKDRILPYVDEICWNIIEQKHFVDWGKANLEDDVLKFHYLLDEVKECNCVIFGSSLQYLEDYKTHLEKISSRKCKYIIIDRVPVSNETWVSIEYVHEPIYEAEYPLFIFSEHELITLLEEMGYVLEMSWIKDTGEVWQIGNKLMKEKSFLFVYRDDN